MVIGLEEFRLLESVDDISGVMGIGIVDKIGDELAGFKRCTEGDEFRADKVVDGHDGFQGGFGHPLVTDRNRTPLRGGFGQ